MPFFSKVFKDKKASARDVKPQADYANDHSPVTPTKPRYTSTWESKVVVPEEVSELLHACTLEIKSRAEALDTPFLLLPFRPGTDVTPAKTFIRNFFKFNQEGSPNYRGGALQQELRLTEPDVLCSVVKWCWSRIPGGVVTWAVYQALDIGERESNMARNAFDIFIPLAVDSSSRQQIIYDFFDLLSAIAAHGKVNGLGGRKVSRMAAWWAFEHSDTGGGFDGGYKSWAEAADASSHMFFAYLRSRAPEAVQGIAGISNLPRSLQALVAQTEYPPQTPALLQTPTSKVLMLVDSVSPTLFALLRRAKNFEYRSEDRALQHFADYSDPTQALTEECSRVLESIASTNQSTAQSRRRNLSNARLPSGLSITGDSSWTRFMDEGFSSLSADETQRASGSEKSTSNRTSPEIGGLQAEAHTRGMVGDRPTTPSWADFLSSGFGEEKRGPAAPPTSILPPEKQLPPIAPTQSEGANDIEDGLEPGELASITRFDLDDTFWLVWMTSLAAEEPVSRRAVFGRCALVETSIAGGKWFVLEEQLKGAAPVPEEGAYIAEKKTRFFSTRKNRVTPQKSAQPRPPPPEHVNSAMAAFQAASATPRRSTITSDQEARIKAAAAELSREQSGQGALLGPGVGTERRGRNDDAASTKTNSVLTLGLSNEASSAMKWATAYDKAEIRKQYLGDDFAGKGLSSEQRASSALSTDFDDRKSQVSGNTLSATATRADERELPLPPPKDERRPEAVQLKSADVLPAPLPPQPYQVPEIAANTVPTSTATRVPLPPATPLETHSAQSPHAMVSETSPLHSTASGEQGRSPQTPYQARVREATPPQEAAEDYPSPVDSPIDNRASHVERKPVSATQVHPALRQNDNEPIVDQQTTGPASPPAQIAAVRAFWQDRNKPQEVPSSTYQEPKKLHKKGAGGRGGGLRNMFGRRKNSSRGDLMEQPTQPTQMSQSSPEPSVGRRSSLLRKKLPTDSGSAVKAAAPEADRSDVVGSTTDYTAPSAHDEMRSVSEYDEAEATTGPRFLVSEHEGIAQEPARFNHGPLADTPAYVPEESYEDNEHDLTPHAPHQESDYISSHPAAPISQQASVYGTPTEPAEPVPDDHQPSHARWQVTRDDSFPNANHWAQIRKNASERAARASEEQSLRSMGQSFVTQGTEAASETSNEETIEDRVARIRARVAELTSGKAQQAGAVDATTSG